MTSGTGFQFRKERAHTSVKEKQRVQINSREEKTTGVKPIYTNKGGSTHEGAGLFCNLQTSTAHNHTTMYNSAQNQSLLLYNPTNVVAIYLALCA